jgi:hypothetical protein
VAPFHDGVHGPLDAFVLAQGLDSDFRNNVAFFHDWIYHPLDAFTKDRQDNP